MMLQKGLAQIFIIGIVVVILAIGAGGYFSVANRDVLTPAEMADMEITETTADETTDQDGGVMHEKAMEPEVPRHASLPPVQGGQLCPDNICDDFEMREGQCREDCANVLGWKEKAPITPPQQQQSQTQDPSQQNQQQLHRPIGMTGETVIKTTGATYKTVSAKPSGWFETGQEANIMLSGHDFNNAGGPLGFNHPGTIDSDGIRLALADRNNNRVLVWNKLPQNASTPPDMVLGQKNFVTNNPGSGLDQMNWPTSVALAGGKFIVADTNNDRILVWNDVPKTNGQTADMAIKNNIRWPWGVWTDGKKMAVVSTGKGSIMLWNNFPLQSDQPADIAITAPEIGTPRMVTSNGESLIIGDHNAKVSGAASESGAGPGGGAGAFFWKKWPTQNDQRFDFFMPDFGAWKRGDFTASGKLALLSDTLLIWNTFPADTNDRADIENGFKYLTGDGSGLAAISEKLYISSANGNKIVVFNSLPSSLAARPDFALGVQNVDDNGLEQNFLLGNPVPATDGKSLFVSADFDCKLYVWKNLPDESGARPDLVFDTSGIGCAWDNVLFGNTFAMAGKDAVMIWNSLPTEARKPDTVFRGRIGSVKFDELRGIAMDSRYFYLSDWRKNKIYVWDGVPEKTSEPKFSISTQAPTRLSSDGKYLAVASMEEGVKIFTIGNITSSSKPSALLGGPGALSMNLPQDVLLQDGRLFVADTNNSRVFVWKNVNDALNQKLPDVILGANDLNDTTAEIGKNKLFWPGALAFDGSFLWIGEFKFSVRLLRFDAQP